MAEITQQSGSWTFDGETLRLVPGVGKGVHQLRAALGELTVPLTALSGVSYEPGRKTGRLRLRLRDGADPLVQVTAGRLPEAADPYALTVTKDRSGVAEYLVDEVRTALLLEQVPTNTPTDRYLLPGPPVPLVLNASDGRVSFNGEEIGIEWGWGAEESKKSSGSRKFSLPDVKALEWSPPRWESGWLRFVPRGPAASVKPSHDPNCVVMWGFREAREVTESALLAAAVTARLPHPQASTASAGPAPAAIKEALVALAKPEEPAPTSAEADPDHDALLRRLRELGELHQSGVLTADEFSATKKSVLDRFSPPPRSNP